MFGKWVTGLVVAAVVSLGGMSAVQANHSPGTINCENFSTGDEVYEFWTSHGYSAENDPEGLDGNDNDGLPCEDLTSGIAGQFSEYEAGLETTNEDTNEETATEEESDEGDALPVTATSYPTMMLFGLFTAGAGALLLFRRKSAQV